MDMQFESTRAALYSFNEQQTNMFIALRENGYSLLEALSIVIRLWSKQS